MWGSILQNIIWPYKNFTKAILTKNFNWITREAVSSLKIFGNSKIKNWKFSFSEETNLHNCMKSQNNIKSHVAPWTPNKTFFNFSPFYQLDSQFLLPKKPIWRESPSQPTLKQFYKWTFIALLHFEKFHVISMSYFFQGSQKNSNFILSLILMSIQSSSEHVWTFGVWDVH